MRDCMVVEKIPTRRRASIWKTTGPGARVSVSSERSVEANLEHNIPRIVNGQRDLISPLSPQPSDDRDEAARGEHSPATSPKTVSQSRLLPHGVQVDGRTRHTTRLA